MPIGIVFGPYEGEYRTEKKLVDSTGYSWEIIRFNQTIYVDGRDSRYSNWMRFINSSRFEAEQNLIAFQYGGSVYYRVFRPINRNSELLVWYGSSYGKALCMITTSVKNLKKKKFKITGKNLFIL